MSGAETAHSVSGAGTAHSVAGAGTAHSVSGIVADALFYESQQL